MNPMTLLNNGFIVILVVLYILLAMINIFQQSLKSSGTNDAMAWYLSPISIIMSFYLTGKLVFELMR